MRALPSRCARFTISGRIFYRHSRGPQNYFTRTSELLHVHSYSQGPRPSRKHVLKEPPIQCPTALLPWYMVNACLPSRASPSQILRQSLSWSSPIKTPRSSVRAWREPPLQYPRHESHGRNGLEQNYYRLEWHILCRSEIHKAARRGGTKSNFAPAPRSTCLTILGFGSPVLIRDFDVRCQ